MVQLHSEYKILDFNESLGQISVLFKDTENIIGISIPIENNRYIEGLALHNYIMSFNSHNDDPIEQKTKRVTNSDVIKKLVEPIDKELLEKEVRLQRDYCLLKSDWLLLPDTGFSDEAVARYKKYRQELRDVPQQPNFPYDVIWPTVDGEWINHKSWK
jgi:hypothetical protein